MATSGSTGFNLSVLEILEEAWERATTQELRTGYEFRTAARSYNLLMLEWQTRGYNLWTVESTAVTLVAAQAVYDLPATALDVVTANYSKSPGNSRALRRMSLVDYAALPNPTVVGTPLNYMATRTVAVPTITLYPVPDNAVDVFTVWYTRRIQDAGTAANTADVPALFLPALIAGVAFHIAKKVADSLPRLPMLQADYEQLFEDAVNDDRDKAPAVFVPLYIGL